VRAIPVVLKTEAPIALVQIRAGGDAKMDRLAVDEQTPLIGVRRADCEKSDECEKAGEPAR
jgi:hypothetical protein